MISEGISEFRLIMISGDFPPRISGVGDYAWHLSKTASTMGLNVTVVTTQCKNNQFDPNIADERSVITDWTFIEAKKILRVLQESEKKTLVNIQYYCYSTYGRRLMINFLPAIIRILRSDIRIVITMHGFWEQSIWYRLRTIPMMRCAHGIIYVDRQNRELISKYGGFEENRLKFIPIAGNIPPVLCTPENKKNWRKELGLTVEDTAVAFFGGIGRNKGFEFLVEAVARARKNSKLSLKLIAIGGFHDNGAVGVYQKRIRNLIEFLGLVDFVNILEQPGPSHVSKYLHACDLAVYPFIQGVGENSGSMLAALAHGLPTIITAGSANDPSFSDRFGVVMVPAMNSESLSKAIVALALNPHQKKIMRKKGLEVTQVRDWNYVTHETIKFCSTLL